MTAVTAVTRQGTVGFEDFLLWVWQCIFMEERLGSADVCQSMEHQWTQIFLQQHTGLEMKSSERQGWTVEFLCTVSEVHQIKSDVYNVTTSYERLVYN